MEEEEDQFGETWVRISQDMVGLIIGKGGQNIKHLTETTETRIERLEDPSDAKYMYFVIKGNWTNRYLAKLKMKQNMVSFIVFFSSLLITIFLSTILSRFLIFYILHVSA